MCKLTSDAKLSEDDTKAVVAALNFILVSSSKFDTGSEDLSNELQQLGLPRGEITRDVNALARDLECNASFFVSFVVTEHSLALCKVYSENSSKLRAALREQSLRCKFC